MKGVRTALTFAVCLMPTAVVAQTIVVTQPALVSPPSWLVNDLACAPLLTMTRPNDRLRITGSQDVSVKQLMGPGDILVINGGVEQGLQVGQQYYVRRLTRSAGAVIPDRNHPLDVHTTAWIKIVAVTPTYSTASITHACDGILVDDYLEPYTPPLIAATPTDGTARLENLGHIMMGDENRSTVSVGEFITIDRGSDHGVVNGQRFSVFRDRRTAAAGPLVEIGMVMAVSVRPDNSTVRIIEAHDAIMRDDLIAIRR